jgi:hypothetical protein
MVKLQDLQRVNAVLDAQGFYIDGKFCPVELTVVGDHFHYHYPLSTNTAMESLSPEEQKNAWYVTTFIHGLEMETFNVIYDCKYSSAELGTLITRLQEVIEYDKKTPAVFGVKHTLLAKVLTSLGIPFVDMEDLDEIRVPTLKELDMAAREIPWVCQYHTSRPLDRNRTGTRCEFRCSSRKASRLWKWLQDRSSGHTAPPPTVSESSDSEDSSDSDSDWGCDFQECSHDQDGVRIEPVDEKIEFKWFLYEGMTGDLTITRFADKPFTTYQAAMDDYYQIGAPRAKDPPEGWISRLSILRV